MTIQEAEEKLKALEQLNISAKLYTEKIGGVMKHVVKMKGPRLFAFFIIEDIETLEDFAEVSVKDFEKAFAPYVKRHLHAELAGVWPSLWAPQLGGPASWEEMYQPNYTGPRYIVTATQRQPDGTVIVAAKQESGLSPANHPK